MSVSKGQLNCTNLRVQLDSSGFQIVIAGDESNVEEKSQTSRTTYVYGLQAGNMHGYLWQSFLVLRRNASLFPHFLTNLLETERIYSS